MVYDVGLEDELDESRVIVHKYMVEARIYPNGKVYTKTYPVGKSKALMTKKPKKGTTIKFEDNSKQADL